MAFSSCARLSAAALPNYAWEWREGEGEGEGEHGEDEGEWEAYSAEVSAQLEHAQAQLAAEMGGGLVAYALCVLWHVLFDYYLQRFDSYYMSCSFL